MDVSWIRLSVCSVLSIAHKFEKLCTATILFDPEFYGLSSWPIFRGQQEKNRKIETLKNLHFHCENQPLL